MTNLETVDGALVHAEVGGVILDAFPLHNAAVVMQVGDEAVVLTPREVRRLAHALSCAITPYGVEIPAAKPEAD